MANRLFAYESRGDRMRFDTSAELENHEKRFGKNSAYDTIQKLEKRERELLNERNQGTNVLFSSLKPSNNQDFNSMKSPASQSQAKLNFLLRSPQFEDPKSRKTQSYIHQSREKEILEELQQYKKDRTMIKEKRTQQYDEYAQLLEELKGRKDRELQAQIEKDQIRIAIAEADKGRYGIEKRRIFERLLNERENLRLTEESVMREAIEIDQNMQNLGKIRNSAMESGSTQFGGNQSNGFELRKTTELLLNENSNKITKLKEKISGIDATRQRIMQELERAKQTDSSFRKNDSGMASASNFLKENNVRREGIASPIFSGFSSPKVFTKLSETPRNNNPPYRDRRNLQISVPYESSSSGQLFNNVKANTSFSSANNKNDSTRGSHGKRISTEQDAQLPDILSVRASNGNGSSGHGQLYRISSMSDPIETPKTLRDEYVKGGGHNPSVLNALNHMDQGWKRNFATQTHSDLLPPLEYQTNLVQKDQEIQKLREELAKAKTGTDKINNIATSGTFSLSEMALKQHGLDQTSSGMLNYNKSPGRGEFFVQNEVRNVDLTEEERLLINLQAQEVDALRMLSQVPIGTELYHFKLAQYKELSTTRSEMEKLIQEQRLAKVRRTFEVKRREEDKQFDNKKYVDDWRKQIIGNRLRKELNASKGERMYDPREGFVIHWDYCLGVPKRMDYIQMVYGIYINGEEVYAPRMIDPLDCEVDTSATNRCIMGESHHLTDVPANSNCLLMFEIQSASRKDGRGRVASYAWSQLDLFDARRQLKRGKFKVPMYVVPTITSIDIDGIKYLEPVDGGIVWFYLRISWPNNDDIASQQKMLHPENTHFEYNIPQIHLRAFRPPVEKIIERVVEREKTPVREPTPEEDPNANKGDTDHLEEVKEEEPEPVQFMKLPNKDNHSHNKGKKPKKKLEETKIEEEPPKSLPPKGKGHRKGIYLIIHQVKNHVARSHMKVAAALFEEVQLVLDERGRQCAFNTTIHNPLDLNAKGNKSFLNNSMEVGMSNKASGQDIIFNEDHSFLRDIPLMLKTQKKRRDVYLNLQVVEKPEPTNIQTTNASIAYKTQDQTANYGNMEFDLFGWYLMKVNDAEGNIISGKFTRPLYKPPLRKPPLDTEKVEQMETEIEFTIQELDFTDKDLDRRQKKKSKKELQAEEEARKKKEEEENKLREIAIDNAPYISNTKPQFTDKTFEKGYGVDFYIDACRFLPDNVTVAKVTFTLVTRDYEIIKQPEAAVPELDSQTYSPLYAFRIELRMDKFDPTSLALISIETIDKSTNETRIVGYSAINLFINRFTKLQPESNTESDIVLLDGRYQLPIFCQEPFRTAPFNIEKMNSLERLPTASLLVRIHHAPLSKDGLRVLSLTDVPKKDWASTGIWRPRPNYGQGVYNTSFCPTRESEKDLFILRQERTDLTVKETAQILLGADGINRELTDKEMLTYLGKKIQRTTSTTMIDLMYFAHYRPQAGFKFALDGIHLAPRADIPYVGVYGLLPPATLYTDEGDTSKIQLTSLLNWEGPAKSPQFLDGYITFKDLNFEKNLCIIIDIRSVNFSKTTPVFSKIGWTICPIFSPDGYVLSGLYQIPLFKGEVPLGIINDLKENDPWPFLMDLVKNKRNQYKLTWLENASVMIRLLDSQREGHFNIPWEVNRIDYRYIPQAKLRESGYNATWEAKLASSAKLQSIVPNKGNPFDYNHKITDAFVEELGLTHFRAE